MTLRAQDGSGHIRDIFQLCFVEGEEVATCRPSVLYNLHWVEMETHRPSLFMSIHQRKASTFEQFLSSFNVEAGKGSLTCLHSSSVV